MMVVGFLGLVAVTAQLAQKLDTIDPSPVTAASTTAAARPAPSTQDVEKSKALSAEAKDLLDGYSGDGRALQQADAKITAALKLDTSNVDAYVEQARYLMKSQNDFGAAQLALRKGLKFNPQHGNAHVLLGYVLTHQDRFDEATREFQAAHQYAATSPWLGMNEAELASHQGNAEAALKGYSEAVKADSLPTRVRAQAYEGIATQLVKLGRNAEARSAYEKAFEVLPDDAWLMGNYACLLRAKMLDVEESEKWARRALAKMDYGMGRECLGKTLYLAWAEALIQEKNKAKADKYFAEAQELVSSPAELLHEIGDYPHEHPIIDALAAKGYSLDQFEGSDGPGSGSTPMEAAVAKRNLALVRQLLRAGAHVDEPGNGGATPLMVAAYGNDMDMIRFLLGKGANPLLLMGDGSDAEALAKEGGHTQAAQLLAEAKAHMPPKLATKAAQDTLQIGHVYRVKVDIPTIHGWGDTFAAGEQVRYAGHATRAVESNGQPKTDLVEYTFQLTTGPGYRKAWAVAKTAPADAWKALFEEVVPQPGK